MFHQAGKHPKIRTSPGLPASTTTFQFASIASEALNGSRADRSWNEVLTEAPSAFAAPLLEVTLGLFWMKVQKRNFLRPMGGL